MTRTRINFARISAIGFCLGFWAFVATHAHAQTAPAPTADQVREDANAIIGALRSQRDDANDKLAQAMASNAKLTHELDAAKKAAEPKKDVVK